MGNENPFLPAGSTPTAGPEIVLHFPFIPYTIKMIGYKCGLQSAGYVVS
jgi:hypothetical protein